MSLIVERHNSRQGAHLQRFEYIHLTVARAADVAATSRRKAKPVRGVRQRSFTQANVSFDDFSYWVTLKLVELAKKGGAL
jgi:hypothetical protein